MDYELNFAQGQSWQMTSVYWYDKHLTLRKIRETFLSLIEEKKVTSAGVS